MTTLPALTPSLRAVLMQDEMLLESGVMYVARNIDAGQLGWAAFDFEARNTYFNRLKGAINGGHIPAQNLDNEKGAFRRSRVNLPDLWRFAQKQPEFWEWLRDVCRVWATARGIDLGTIGQEPPASSATIAAERRCREWLVSMMKAGNPQKPKGKYAEDAKEKFSIGSKAFVRAWAAAIQETGASEWSRPGRKS